MNTKLKAGQIEGEWEGEILMERNSNREKRDLVRGILKQCRKIDKEKVKRNFE